MAIIDNLISYWKFDENAANTTVADAHASNTGTSQNNTSTMYNASGVINSAFDWDGSSDYVTVPHVSALAPTSGTVSLWVYLTANNKYIIDKNINADNGYGMVGRTDDTVDFYINTGSGLRVVDTNNSVTQNAWHHLVMTWDDTEKELIAYIDGSSIGTYDFTGESVVTGTTNLKIGDTTLGGKVVAGIMDEVGIWGRAIDSTEVTSLYNSGNGLAYPFSATYDFTKTGNSRLKILDTEVTKSAQARIQINDTEQVYDGIARIKVPQSFTKTSNARIQILDTEFTKSANSRILIQSSLDKSANSRIQINDTEFTKSGNAYIRTSKYFDKTGQARIFIEDNEFTKNGNAKLMFQETFDKSSQARILIQSDFTKTSNARILLQSQINKSANARIKISQSLTKEANAAILIQSSFNKSANASVTFLGSFDKTGNASIFIENTFKPKIKLAENIKPKIKLIETFN